MQGFSLIKETRWGKNQQEIMRNLIFWLPSCFLETTQFLWAKPFAPNKRENREDLLQVLRMLMIVAKTRQSEKSWIQPVSYLLWYICISLDICFSFRTRFDTIWASTSVSREWRTWREPSGRWTISSTIRRGILRETTSGPGERDDNIKMAHLTPWSLY